SVVVLGVYLFLNAVVIGSGLLYLAQHPELVETWLDTLRQGSWHVSQPFLVRDSRWGLAALCLLSFPWMALGLSGFELSMVVMPLVQGDPADTPTAPQGRIRNTRKLLVTAGLVMAVYLLGSALVT